MSRRVHSTFGVGQRSCVVKSVTRIRVGGIEFCGTRIASCRRSMLLSCAEQLFIPVSTGVRESKERKQRSSISLRNDREPRRLRSRRSTSAPLQYCGTMFLRAINSKTTKATAWRNQRTRTSSVTCGSGRLRITRRSRFLSSGDSLRPSRNRCNDVVTTNERKKKERKKKNECTNLNFLVE